MRMRELYIAAFAVGALAWATSVQAQGHYGIGRSATPAEIAGWNIDIDRDGNNLPPGSGTALMVVRCSISSAGPATAPKARAGVGDRLVGGQGTLATPKPVRTVGSYCRTPRPCSIISAAPCRRTRRNR